MKDELKNLANNSRIGVLCDVSQGSPTDTVLTGDLLWYEVIKNNELDIEIDSEIYDIEDSEEENILDDEESSIFDE